MTEQNETVVVGSCPTCGGPAQIIGDDTRIDEYRHVDLRPAAIRSHEWELGERFKQLDAKLEQIANGHKCIACGMEHPACCGSCRTHCYKCGQPRLTHDEDRCHAKWVNREPPTTEAEELAEHCRVNNITNHSINADGSCNMGCC
jgi:hypothetical protein